MKQTRKPFTMREFQGSPLALPVSALLPNRTSRNTTTTTGSVGKKGSSIQVDSAAGTAAD